MRVADMIPQSQEAWLRALVGRRADDVFKLFLVYNDRRFGPDTAREHWDAVVGEDFVPQEDSGIISNEQLRAEGQQGVTRPFTLVPEGEEYQWWLEVYVDQDPWDLLPTLLPTVDPQEPPQGLKRGEVSIKVPRRSTTKIDKTKLGRR